MRRQLGSAMRRCRPTLLLLLVVLGGGCASSDGASQANGASQQPFPEPPLLSNASSAAGTLEATLTAAPATVELVPGIRTQVYAYNGTVPGPTIDVSEGDHVVIHFTNGLPEPTTVHWHGLHVPAAQDGNPQDAIAPGGRHDYVFDIPRGSAGTYWYHPHVQAQAAHQTEMGLEGAIRVHAKSDPLPPEVADTLLFLGDNTLDDRGQIAPQTMVDRMNGREGHTLFVNGLVRPTLFLRAGEMRRLRIVNGSAARYYLLSVPDHTLLQIGTDGGLFGTPQPHDRILLAPAERIEVLLAATAAPGTTTVLQALPYDRRAKAEDMTTSVTSAEEDLLTIQYLPDPPVASPVVHGPLREVVPIDTTGAGTRRFTFTEDMMKVQFFINGASFDPNRVDEHARLGATEVWTVRNEGEMDHPFHLHGFRFQVLDRSGAPEPVVAWKDTVNLRADDVVRIAVKLDDFPGVRMYHCHILEHEDAGMLGMIDVE